MLARRNTEFLITMIFSNTSLIFFLVTIGFSVGKGASAEESYWGCSTKKTLIREKCFYLEARHLALMGLKVNSKLFRGAVLTGENSKTWGILDDWIESVHLSQMLDVRLSLNKIETFLEQMDLKSTQGFTAEEKVNFYRQGRLEIDREFGNIFKQIEHVSLSVSKSIFSLFFGSYLDRLETKITQFRARVFVGMYQREAQDYEDSVLVLNSLLDHCSRSKVEIPH